MQVREAKDFMIQQALHQASIENLAVSDNEKKLLYFSESDEPQDAEAEDPASYPEYEKKFSGLLHRTYKRLRNEQPDFASRWDAAMRELRKGDHYVLVVWNCGRPPKLMKRDFYWLNSNWVYICVAALALTLAIAYLWHLGYSAGLAGGRHYHPASGTIFFIPSWVQHAFLALIAFCYLFYVFRGSALAKIIIWVVAGISGRFRSKNSN